MGRRDTPPAPGSRAPSALPRRVAGASRSLPVPGASRPLLVAATGSARTGDAMTTPGRLALEERKAVGRAPSPTPHRPSRRPTWPLVSAAASDRSPPAAQEHGWRFAA